ncbi:MAG: universal stress protein [Gammaproteobacteria bacterium]|nr:universal stress protein [Gammaproteobacteria bacterium]
MGNISTLKLSRSETRDAVIQLLIPIDATDESRWGLRYAVRRVEAGTSIEVLLLYIAEPVRNWEVLRFHTEDEVRKFHQERAVIFLDEAADVLDKAKIPYRAYLREADAVQGVIDFAEELNCSEIVVPKTSWFGLFAFGLGQRLLKQRCPVCVTLTKEDGSAA